MAITLTQACGTNDSTLYVNGNPSSDIVNIDSERIRIWAHGTTVLQVIRGYDGSVAASHALGATVAPVAEIVGTQGTDQPVVGGTSVTSTPTEINRLAGVTPGTAAASSVAVLGTSKNLDILGLPVGGLKIGASGAEVAITDTGAELNTLHSSGITNQDLINLHAAIPQMLYGPTGFLAETVSRALCPEANLTVATTGQVFNQLIFIPGGTVVTNISFCSATSAANVPTHYAFGLYTYSASAPSLLASTADQTTTAWGANTVKTLALTAPYTVTTSGLYYVAFSMVATGVPTLKGMTARTDGTLAGTAPILAGINATSYSTGTLPAALTTTTAGVNSVWCGLS